MSVEICISHKGSQSNWYILSLRANVHQNTKIRSESKGKKLLSLRGIGPNNFKFPLLKKLLVSYSEISGLVLRISI